MPVRRKITALAVGAVAVTGGIPAGASAAEPGFTVDPQSPAGVEYQVPLDNARNQGGGGSGHHGGGGFGSTTGGGGNSSGGATGGGGGSSAGTGSSNLFGTGISPATAGSGASGAGGSSVGTAGGATGGGAGGHGSGAPSGEARHFPAITTTADYSSTGPVAGIVHLQDDGVIGYAAIDATDRDARLMAFRTLAPGRALDLHVLGEDRITVQPIQVTGREPRRSLAAKGLDGATAQHYAAVFDSRDPDQAIAVAAE